MFLRAQPEPGLVRYRVRRRLRVPSSKVQRVAVWATPRKRISGGQQVAATGAKDGGDGFFGGNRALGQAADGATSKADLFCTGSEACAISAGGRQVVEVGHVGAAGLGCDAERVRDLHLRQVGTAVLVVDDSPHMCP